MNVSGDIKFTISGLGKLTETAISGVNLYYGINMIPHATLYLNVDKVKEQDPQLLCNPDAYKSKQKMVYIDIETKSGCIYFEGYLDGISFSQTVGNINYTAVLKSKFQSLVETYPRVLGLMPGSYAPYKSVDAIKTENPELFNQLSSINIGEYSVDATLPLAQFLAKSIAFVANTQKNPEAQINAIQPHYLEIINNEYYKQNLEIAEKILNNLDTAATEKTEITGEVCGSWIVSLLQGEFPTLWDMMVAAYQEINCVLVCGNEKIFVVPDAKFLKYKDHTKPKIREESKKPNQANPVDFNHLVINDTGYCNIRYCLNEIDPSTVDASALTWLGIPNDKPGYYIAPPSEVADSAAGLYINRLSNFALNGISYLANSNTEAKNNGNFASDADVPENPEDVSAKYEQLDEKIKEEASKQSEDEINGRLNKLAKIGFLTRKFEDRCGSFTMVFDPKWVPGSTASVYTRVPGLFFQGYVTNVSHDIKLHVPGELEVTTSINMSCIRQSAETSNMQGVEDDGLYGYTADDMSKYWNRWLMDVTK